MTEENLMQKLDWKKMDGLIPVVVQDAETKEVLMLAYANKEALIHTLKTGRATYWSRSRQQLWVKGETSGHTQKIKSVLTDCDCDTLLYIVEQKGPACHTGSHNCFFNRLK
jgi:phosphoribosyl-AMP cyclohydrolase